MLADIILEHARSSYLSKGLFGMTLTISFLVKVYGVVLNEITLQNFRS